MELTFVVAVKDIWQLQSSWLQPSKGCDQGRSVGKYSLLEIGKWSGLVVFHPPPPPPPPREFLILKKMEMLINI